MRCVVAYDCGTTSLKAAVIELGGEVLAETTETFRVHQPQPGWAEQDPDELWDTLCRSGIRALREAGVGPGSVAGVVFVAPWKNIIPVSASGQVLHPSVIWMDGRAGEQASVLNERLGEFVGTGQEYWPRLMWLKQHHPRDWADAAYLMGLTTYFKWRATGRVLTEPSDDFVFGTGERQQARFARILQVAGLAEDIGKFAPVGAATDLVGRLTDDAARQAGLTPGTPVFGGFGDLPAITVGAGRARPGEAHIYFGTSSWLVTVAPLEHAGTAPLTFTLDADRQGLVHPLQTGGLAYDWIVDQVYAAEKASAEDVHALIGNEVAQLGPGSDGLLATHWLSGELPPLAKNAKGLFLNLTSSHDRRHLVRAMMESVCYSHRSSLERQTAEGQPAIKALRVVGGGATSDVWMQMLADVLQVEIQVPDRPRLTGVWGAYACAAVALGEIASLESLPDLAGSHRSFVPNPAHREVYDRMFGIYQQLYPALRPIFDQLNRPN